MTETPKTAVVLAGGFGLRLRPYTVVLPKPLMPVGDMPILEVIVRQLVRHGFRRIVMAVNYQAEIIRAFFAGGEKFGVSIEYSLETEPLGTMGPLHLIDGLPDNFIVMNGDILCDLDFGAFFAEHAASRAPFTIGAARRVQQIDYGVLIAGDDGHLTGFSEKPTTNYLVSMGVYAVNRQVLELIPRAKFGFDQLMLRMIEEGRQVRVVPHDSYWLDIGRPDDYHRAIEEWQQLRPAMGI